MQTLNQSGAGTAMKKTYSPIKKGEYKAKLASLELKPTKAGNGTIASAIFEFVGGQYGKDESKPDSYARKIFHTFLVDHTNPKAVEFSNNKLNKLLKAAGTGETIENLSNDFDKVRELVSGKDITIGVDLNMYEKDGETVVGNKITTFKKNQA